MAPRRGAPGRGLDALITPLPVPGEDPVARGAAEVPGAAGATPGRAHSQAPGAAAAPDDRVVVARETSGTTDTTEALESREAGALADAAPAGEGAQVEALAAGVAQGPVELPAQGGALEVELGRIEPNPRQPRRQIDEVELAELADSIREHGLIQPLVVTPLEERSSARAALPARPRYRLIAGQRRWQAAQLAGLVRVPVVVRQATPRQLLELALVENVQRTDLNPLEEAAAYQQLSLEFGLTQEAIGQRVGKSRFAVANTLRLLHLPAAVQRALVDGRLSEGHARALLGLGDQEGQRRLADQVVEQGLSVRQTEELVRRMQQPPQPETQRRVARRRSGSLSPDVLELEARLRQALGTKVNLTHSARGGRVVIHYYDDEQLQSLIDRLGGD